MATVKVHVLRHVDMYFVHASSVLQSRLDV